MARYLTLKAKTFIIYNIKKYTRKTMRAPWYNKVHLQIIKLQVKISQHNVKKNIKSRIATKQVLAHFETNSQ